MILGLRGRREKTVGLDVGTALLKAAVVDHARGRPRLERVAIRRVPPGGEVGPSGSGAEAGEVRSLLAELPVDGAGLIADVGGRDLIVKVVRTDRVPEEDARDVIRWEAGQHLPVEIEEVALDFEIMDPDGGGPRMTVVLVAAKKGRVRERLAALRDAGFDPDVLDAEPFAVLNALQFNHPASADGVVGVASIGHDHTSLGVVDRGAPVLWRTLPFGAGRLRDRIASEHGLEPGEAAALLRPGGDRPPPPVRATVASAVGGLAGEVERASAYLESRGDGVGVGHLYLCGGGAALRGIDDGLARHLGVEVHAANPVEALPHAPGALDAVDAERDLPLLVPAVGMALRRVA